MKNVQPLFFFLLLIGMIPATCFGGPSVSPHPNEKSVSIRNNRFEVERVLSDPREIQLLQEIFLRAKRVGDTESHLKNPTHNIDFSDRWLLDMERGEVGVLSKTVSDVYQISPQDLEVLRKLIEGNQ